MDSQVCPFYRKIGTCRHGDKCSKSHPVPYRSDTLIIAHMYNKENVNEFVEDLIVEAGQIAPVVDVLISGNESEHMKGNVYLSFQTDEDAERVLTNFNRRWYGGRPVYAARCPVHDLRTAVCRQAETSSCDRGGQCNYVHPVRIDGSLLNSLWASQQVSWS